MAELGELSLRIQAEGDQAVLSTLQKVDAEARKVGARTIAPRVALSPEGRKALESLNA
jgi:hypothetical protein